jgi:hypothetical protein
MTRAPLMSLRLVKLAASFVSPEGLVITNHRSAIAPLVDLPEKDWPAKGAILINPSQPTFMLKLGPSLRAFVRPTPGGKPEVQDFVHQETLDMFKSRTSTQEPSAPLTAGKPS